jgi:hypothetical protein
MPDFVTVSKPSGEVTLARGVIASVRPRVSGHGSLIICFGGAVHSVEDSYASVAERLSA